MLTRRQFEKISFLALASGLTNCAYPFAQHEFESSLAVEGSDLVIFWERGYLPEENRGILELVEQWQQISGKVIHLKLVSDDFIEQELLEIAKNPRRSTIADIIFSISFNHNLAPTLAWQDRLVDLSEIIEPAKVYFNDTVLHQVRYFNQAQNKHQYYALPIGQADAYIHYWKDLLTRTGHTEKDIPDDWMGFWEFWKTAHEQLKSHQDSHLFGLGLCMSASGFDTSLAFQLFMDAYDVVVVDSVGVISLAMAENRQKFIEVINQFTKLYLQKYVPPDAIEWSGSGNNTNFLNRRSLMTINLTLSIPRTQKVDLNSYNLDAAQRYRQIGTLAEYPRKLDGEKLYARRIISQIIALKKDRNSSIVLDFLQYIIKPENIRLLTQGFNGRILPVMPKLLQESPWIDNQDPHIAAALQLHYQTRRANNSLHPVLGEVYTHHLWAQTILKVIQDKFTPTQAGDWAISQIQQLWKQRGSGI